MSTTMRITRRAALTTLAAASGAAALAASVDTGGESVMQDQSAPSGRLKQSVSRWCYGEMPLEELCRAAKAMGVVALDLLGPDDWAPVLSEGLACAMCNGPGGITDGWNEPSNHDHLVARSEELLPHIAELGLKNMIVFSGNRRRITDDEGISNCARGLERILPLAESLGVTLHMELLNSKRDHRDYQCDHTAWGVKLAKRLGTNHFKLLYDIYHMQIMEGDVIATIEENIAYIGHFHTGGVPGRNEIDATQELNYRRICEAIADTGFNGHLAHEFVPTGDPMTSLRHAVELCAV